MKNYIIKQLNDNQFFIINLNHFSILNYLNDIQNESLIKLNSGELIVDQLLVAGIGKNRFISCQFSFGKIELGTAKNIEGNYEYRKITTEVLRHHKVPLKYSILTNSQVKMIQ